MSDDIWEKVLATSFIVVLLIALTQVFDWNWFGEPKQQEWRLGNDGTASPFRRDWRTQMPYRWINELGEEGERDIYLVVETLEMPLTTYILGKGDQEVQRRVYTCMSLSEAEAVPMVAPLENQIEIFKVSVNRGGAERGASTIRRDKEPLLIWSGQAGDYRRHDVWVGESHAEKLREKATEAAEEKDRK